MKIGQRASGNFLSFWRKRRVRGFRQENQSPPTKSPVGRCLKTCESFLAAQRKSARHLLSNLVAQSSRWSRENCRKNLRARLGFMAHRPVVARYERRTGDARKRACAEKLLYAMVWQ